MNTKGLAKQYDKLAPKERLPLIVAASLRGDDLERERLMNSAPRHLYRLPDYHWLADDLQSLVLILNSKLLDLAVSYWRMLGLLEQEAIYRIGESKKREAR